MLANVYVDGFNLYYSCIKDTPYRWLNLLQLCQLCFPHHTIRRIRYFTARVRATDSDPQKPQRQALFIRALQTLPNLSVHYGTFLTHTVTMRLANPPPRGPYTADVVRTEEKGSDVNLASYMLVDGFDRDYELAIVVSNDSDLVEPIRLVRERLGLSVGLLNPQMDEHKTAWALMKAATFYRTIRRGVLQASQFPPILSDAHGQFFKPPTW